MKWKELSLKERKQVYDSIRVNNPDASYMDIKEQFDSIPVYEDGKNSESEQAWKINETVRLAMEGNPVPQDSLQHIIDRANVQNKPRPYNPSVGAIEQGKQVLSGLNKTVGKAATGASLLTMGGWNLLRTLGIGNGTPYRLWAAKNASTGAKAGAAADVAQFVENPNVDNALQTVLSLFPLGSKGYINPRTKVTGLLESVADTRDLIPAYEDGKSKTINKEDLPPEYRVGTPEYFERQRKISGSVNTVQPEAYVTPAGYIKDAVNFIEDLGKGDYTGAAVDAVMNIIPFGIGKGIKKLKSKVGRIVEGVDEYSADSYAEAFTPTVTKKGKKGINKPSEEAETNEMIRLANNRRNYESEISKSIEDAVFPDNKTHQLLRNVDDMYGTNYKKAYSTIAMRDMTNRGKYMAWGTPSNGAYGNTKFKINDDGTTSNIIQDYQMILNADDYMPGTANHELGHISDGLAGSRLIKDIDSGNEYVTNAYLNYLTNASNTYSTAELRKMGLHSTANYRSYLLNPTEAKSHMLTLKRALKKNKEINNWSDTVDEAMVLRYMNDPNSNNMIKHQYNLYKNKDEYIERLNKLIPMELVTPIGGMGLITEIKDNKK